MFPPLVGDEFKVWTQHNLFPGLPGLRFNPSIVRWRDGYVFAFRNGWKGSDIYLVSLDLNFQGIGNATRLILRHAGCNYGREDPRLFVHENRLHVMFTGVVGGKRIRHTNVLIARLGEEFHVERLWHPKISGRKVWEKNHVPFSHDGELFSVYSIRPHKILKIDGDRAEFVYEEESFPWTGGEPHGGACPVRVGDEYWHFCHDKIEVRRRVYRTLLYTFEAKPPFRPVRYVPEPLVTADEHRKPADQYCYCVWAGGAVREGDNWVLSNGIHDRFSSLSRMSHSDLESKLIKVPNGI